MNYQEACDMLVYATDVVVRKRASEFTSPPREGQTFGAWYLDQCITQQGYSRTDAAKKLNVSRSFIYDVINGTKGISETLASSLAVHMDFTPHELDAVRALDLMAATNG